MPALPGMKPWPVHCCTLLLDIPAVEGFRAHCNGFGIAWTAPGTVHSRLLDMILPNLFYIPCITHIVLNTLISNYWRSSIHPHLRTHDIVRWSAAAPPRFPSLRCLLSVRPFRGLFRVSDVELGIPTPSFLHVSSILCYIMFSFDLLNNHQNLLLSIALCKSCFESPRILRVLPTLRTSLFLLNPLLRPTSPTQHYSLHHGTERGPLRGGAH